MNRVFALASLFVFGSTLTLLPAVQAQIALRGDLTVTIDALRSQEGNVCLKLFSSRPGFPNQDEGAVWIECVPIDEVPLTVTIEDLPSGNYAMAVYHDANEDGVLNRNALGMPTEGYGFSNDAPATTGPARFEDAMFLVAGSSTTIEIQMRYP
jgi:uncharacterized protein (DUF2141 family)